MSICGQAGLFTCYDEKHVEAEKKDIFHFDFFTSSTFQLQNYKLNQWRNPQPVLWQHQNLKATHENKQIASRVRLCIHKEAGRQMRSPLYARFCHPDWLHAWECFSLWHPGIVTYIVAPGEHRAPLCGDTRSCGAVDSWPGLVGVNWDDRGTVRAAWGSRCVWATQRGRGISEADVCFEKQCHGTFGIRPSFCSLTSLSCLIRYIYLKIKSQYKPGLRMDKLAMQLVCWDFKYEPLI